MGGSTSVYWKWEVEDDDGEPWGPVWINRPDGSVEDWDEWVRRSAAQAYAAEHGYEFVADE